jgi:hypothetical protein
MKTLIFVTIDGPSRNDIEGARMSLSKALGTVIERVNNGSEIRISSCNAENSQEMFSSLGKIVAWAFNKVPERIPVKMYDWMKGYIE